MNPHDVASPTEEEMELDRLREENRKLRKALDILMRTSALEHRQNPRPFACNTCDALRAASAALSQTKGGEG